MVRYQVSGIRYQEEAAAAPADEESEDMAARVSMPSQSMNSMAAGGRSASVSSSVRRVNMPEDFTTAMSSSFSMMSKMPYMLQYLRFMNRVRLSNFTSKEADQNPDLWAVSAT